MSSAGVSLVIPVYNEAENVPALFESVLRNLGPDAEVLICYDADDDDTLPAAREWADRLPNLRLVKNQFGRGPLGAIKSGFDASTKPAMVVAMADLSDDFACIAPMLALYHEGCHVVAGSRYMKGGSQIGGPLIKRTLSRLAGVSLHYLVGLRTHDATNSFRLYSRKLLDAVTIESDGGFELGIELTVKAHLLGFKVGESPTTWLDRTAGTSRFRLWKWLPKYLRWYLRAIAGSWFRLGIPKPPD
jgi:dolichol-phosphate mannosyltransferase